MDSARGRDHGVRRAGLVARCGGACLGCPARTLTVTRSTATAGAVSASTFGPCQGSAPPLCGPGASGLSWRHGNPATGLGASAVRWMGAGAGAWPTATPAHTVDEGGPPTVWSGWSPRLRSPGRGAHSTGCTFDGWRQRPEPVPFVGIRGFSMIVRQERSCSHVHQRGWCTWEHERGSTHMVDSAESCGSM